MTDTFTIDKIDYYYEKACENYCEEYSLEPEQLTEEQLQEVYLYAGNHIGFFLAWVIKHDFIGEIHKEDELSIDAINKVKAETMTGTEFLIEFCDTKFWSEDVVDELIPFIKEYYEKQYFNDYTDWVVHDLCDLPLEFIGDWEDYHEFEPIIDKAYKEFCSNL